MAELKQTLRHFFSTLRKLARSYGDLVVNDPELVSKLETGIRIFSYLVPGAH